MVHNKSSHRSRSIIINMEYISEIHNFSFERSGAAKGIGSVPLPRHYVDHESYRFMNCMDNYSVMQVMKGGPVSAPLLLLRLKIFEKVTRQCSHYEQFTGGPPCKYDII